MLRLVLIFLTFAGPAWAGQACVTNGADESLYFRIDAAQLGPDAQLLGPEGEICIETPLGTHATGRVFRALNDLEGCSRLIESGTQDILLKFSMADRCEWASHSSE